MAHETLGAEARALLDVLSEKLEQAAQPTGETHDPTRCTSCPICAAMTYLKEHRELSTQLAQGALLVVSALRQYLDHPTGGGAPTGRPASNTVQHIDIT
jgi:hypothetical protein